MGVGTTLKTWFGYFGLVDRPGCQCRKAACLLDLRGPTWASEHQSKILGWLRRSAKKRGIPFNEHVARIVLDWAIRRARETKSLESAKELV